ncbi:Protein phosphatase 2C [Spironucleus salmonicida]|uniref:Protein phosphatase 2C n=1 Tax=Spironucleus salmonicida TaxID=348837 RepID=V6LB52_9EUKA|nr:Protein phosphatase 2C [Spironucleus salmonicida]|eukprot:EST41468.1 Protein phosphatase 2C [Spironucleus salmonicida]
MIKLLVSLPSFALPLFFLLLGPMIYYKKRLKLTKTQFIQFDDLSISAGAFTDIGPRPTNEDQHIISTKSNFLTAVIFDGHCGDAASTMAAEEFLLNFEKMPQNDDIFNKFTDINMFIKENTSSGCTVCSLFVQGRDIKVANVGDSRCVVVRQTGGIAISKDHKPSRPSEKARIMQNGGNVRSINLGVCRMFPGGLSVSRALGDREMELVSGIPEIFEGQIQDIDEAIIVACDGLWDIFSPDEVANFLNKHRPDAQIKGIEHVKSLSSAENVFFRGLSQVVLEMYGKIKAFVFQRDDNFELNQEQLLHADAIAAQIIAQKLVDSALLRNSQDNVSVIVNLIRQKNTPTTIKQWRIISRQKPTINEKSQDQRYQSYHSDEDSSLQFLHLD